MSEFIIEDFPLLKNKNFSCIYYINNDEDNKKYIGQTSKYITRAKRHKRELKSGTHSNRYLRRVFEKGVFFTLNVLEFCKEDELDERETFWVKFLKTNNPEFGYNLCEGGKGRRGFKHTEEWKDNLRIRNSKRDHLILTKSLFRPLLCYDLNGFFIKEFECGRYAERELNLVKGLATVVARGDQVQTGGYVFRFKESSNFSKKIVVPEIRNGKLIILQLSGMEIIKKWKNKKDLCEHLKVRKDWLTRELRFKGFIDMGGYIFKYK